MFATLHNVRIAAIASSLPGRVLEMRDLADEFGEIEVKRIIRSTGIEAVRLAGELTTGDLCCTATNALFEALNIDRASIDALLLVTQTPDYSMPATSAVLQKRLGLRADVFAMDMNYGCSGYVTGLYQAAMMVASGGCKRVLLLTGDVISKLLHPNDRHVRMVFGDAACATLVEQGEGNLDFSFQTDGGGASHIHTPINYAMDAESAARVGFLHMNGVEVMNFALQQVPAAIDAFLSRHQMQRGDVSYFLLHQANQFMLQYLTKRLGVNQDKVPIEVRRVGNTGPNSIPLAISLGSEINNFHQDNLIACGFGVGLSLGVARLSLSQTSILKPTILERPTWLESGQRMMFN